MERVTRRRFLAGLGGVVAAGLAVEGFLLEPGRLSVTRHRLGSPGARNRSPLRLALLTDLHLGTVGSFERSVAAAVDALEPDVLLMGGDAVDERAGLPALEVFLRLLPSGIPRYATLGNWEYWAGIDPAALAALYERAGWELLVNCTSRLRYGGRAVDVVGVDDLVAGRPDLGAATAGVDLSANVVLLSHCPAFRDRLPAVEAGPITCMLSGHTHGGQVALGRWAPFRPYGSGDYVSGWYRGGGPDLYVSRGLGTSVVPVRLGSVPEVALLEWFLG